MELSKKSRCRNGDPVIVCFQTVGSIGHRAVGVTRTNLDAHAAFNAAICRDHGLSRFYPDCFRWTGSGTMSTSYTPFRIQPDRCQMFVFKRKRPFPKSVTMKLATYGKRRIICLHQRYVPVGSQFDHSIRHRLSAGDDDACYVHHLRGTYDLRIYKARNKYTVICRIQHDIAHQIRSHRIGIFPP